MAMIYSEKLIGADIADRDQVLLLSTVYTKLSAL